MALGKTERKPLDPGLTGLRPPSEINIDQFEDEPRDNAISLWCGEAKHWCGRRKGSVKTWWYTQSPRRRLGCVAFTLLFWIGGIVGLVIFLTTTDSSKNDAPAPVPAPMPTTSGPIVLDDPANRESNILAQLEKVSSAADLKDESSPQYTAFRWIVIDDDLNLQSSSVFLAQRYTMAVFFFSLNGPDWKLDDPWIDTDGFNKEQSVDTPESECMWEGIECGVDNLIQNIDLSDKGLTGELPSSELIALPHLKKLDLRENSLSGELPEELTGLTHLVSLLLEGNSEITGGVSSELCSQVKWLTLNCDTVQCDCCANCDGEPVTLSGNDDATTPEDDATTPAEGRIAEINQLIQKVSPSSSSPGSPQNASLNWILYGDDKKVGISDDTLIQRYALGVAYHALGGDDWSSASSWLTAESECRYPGVACNEEGVVTTIAMVGNGLKGTLPPELGLLDEIEFLDLSDNEIGGEIPSALAELDSLESLLLQNNNLEGGVPGKVCGLRETGLKEFKTDCGGAEPKVFCGCCTNCDSIVMEEKADDGGISEDSQSSKLDYSALFGSRGKLVAQVIAEVSEEIYIPDTTRAEAMEWILKEDPMSLEHDDEGLVQRWVMALLYFQFGGANWIYTNYLNSDNECDWDQVTCDDDGQVTEIALTNGGLMGLVPFELGALKSLKKLNLSGNFIEGEAPDEFCLEEDATSDYALESIIFDCMDPPLVDCDCCAPCDGDDSSGSTTSGNPQIIDYLAVFGRRGQRIAEVLEVVTEGIYARGSNRAAAAEWIIKEDAMDMEHSDPLLLQRFVLALLHFQLDGSNWVYDKYLTKESECEWDGITCNDDNQVTDIVLSDGGLLGVVPFELGVLDSLKVLDMHGNRIEGEVPEEFCDATADSDSALETLIFDCMVPALVDCDCCTPCENDGDVMENDKDDTGDEEDDAKDKEGANLSSTPQEQVDYQKIAGRRGTRIAEVLKEFSDNVYVPGSSASSATIWIAKDDSMGMEHDDDGLLQRWILAVLYFQLDGPNWEVDSFLSGDDECNWDGVTCNDVSQVTSVVLTDVGLLGVVPPEITDLDELTTLDLRGNRLEGEVPDELCADDEIEVLVLDCSSTPLVECDCCTSCDS